MWLRMLLAVEEVSKGRVLNVRWLTGDKCGVTVVAPDMEKRPRHLAPCLAVGARAKGAEVGKDTV